MNKARSPLECRLFIELHPCRCGGAIGDITHRLVTRDDILCACYAGRCTHCGEQLEYVFVLDAEIVAPTAIGGTNPSTIIDAGQYMATSERAARQVRVGGSTDPKGSAKAFLVRAIACLDEVVKWMPIGTDQVPVSAFFTIEGLRLYMEDPGRFRRVPLLAVLAAYRELLLRLDDDRAPR
jgi:hypothetical protein